MSGKFTIKRQGNFLVPTSDLSQELLEQLKPNIEYWIDPKTGRYLPFHMKFWKNLSLVIDNSDYYHLWSKKKALEDLHTKAKFGINCVTEVELLIEKQRFMQRIPKSTRFDKMGGLEFDTHYKDTMLWLPRQDYLNTDGII